MDRSSFHPLGEELLVDAHTMSWLHQLPKVELHLHLEGAIPLSTLWELFQKYGGEDDIHSFESFADRFKYRDFPHFIEVWVWKNGFLREYEDFEFVAEAVARHLASQTIRYAEIYFSPSDFAHHGLKVESLAESIRAGLSRVPDIEVGLVADLVRDQGPQNAETTLEELVNVRDQGVIGVGLGGSEQSFPAELFQSVFERARSLGFKTTAHAGEAAGSDSVWAAVHRLGVDRIGHGTRANEDPELIDYLAEHQVPLELCPVSNVCTGVVESIADHPARRYFDRELMVTVNTDDPAMFGTSLALEYAHLMNVFEFSREEICGLVVNAIDASWMPEERRSAYLADFLSNTSR